jgi:bacteriorhodopsin
MNFNRNTINLTAKYSLIAQVITAIIDYLALQIDIPPNLIILKQLLTLELIVQIIEGIFYIWLVKSFHKVENITKFRYYDWGLSTPIMLFTLICYTVHIQEPNKTLKEIYEENKEIIQTVLVLNFFMLYFGYLGETNKMSVKSSVFIGFIPFIIYYKMIYHNYVREEVLDKKQVSEENRNHIRLLFWYFFIFWSLYGVSALLPYTQKNVYYNILDLFSKNFFGLFLSYIVYTNRTIK